MHGFLYGYNENNNKHGMIRGKRIFCSNRNNRTGCGRTINIFKSYIIKYFTFTACTIWSFLNNIINGLNIFQAFKILNIKASASTPYRLFARFKEKQSELRSMLFRLTKPPDSSKYDNSVFQTIEHLIKAFKNCECPVSAFQYTTQTSIF